MYDINIQKGMIFMQENKLNKIPECNLLNDILNPYKCTKFFI